MLSKREESELNAINAVKTLIDADPVSTQPCGCDPGHRSHSVLGYRCSYYPTCAWGQNEMIRKIQEVKKPAVSNVGIGGAPTRATTLPDDPKERKKYPIATGVLDYFPDAIIAVSRVSYEGNVQHNPGQPLHWDRSKSTDEDDTMLRHFMGRGTRDKDGTRHSAKMVWRALAYLQKEIEAEQAQTTWPMSLAAGGGVSLASSSLQSLGSVLRNEEEFAGR